VLLRLATVFFSIPSPNDDNGQTVLLVLSMQPDQMRCEFIARPALRIGENQKHAAAAVLLQRNHPTLQVGKLKKRSALAGPEPLSCLSRKTHPPVKQRSAPLAPDAWLDSES
jgi:hypothetical protein